MESSKPPLPEAVKIEVDGRPLEADAGLSVAAVLLRAGIRSLRRSPAGSPRGAFCMMGVCQECLVEIDGVRRQACLVTTEPGMGIVTGESA
jgi:predicted molibdopterin-dependent oxidoreductase YjgC